MWRSVRIEISPDEAGIGSAPHGFAAPSLSHFGIPTPDELVGIALRFQIAQKLHACTNPHNPPTSINDRPRDLVDLLLLRNLVAADDAATVDDLRAACLAVFEGRAAETENLGVQPRQWPPTITAHPHWVGDYNKSAQDAGLDVTLEQAVTALNDWISSIDDAG